MVLGDKLGVFQGGAIEMKSNIYLMTASLAIAALLLPAAFAAAAPDPDGVVIHERVFNDCPGSVLTTVNSYPAYISFHDAELSCGGFANRHAWRFSEDGGITDAVFDNADSFGFGAWMTISGTAEGEGGIQLSPWWSQQVDGSLSVSTETGAIICWGGRLPYFSFTSSYGLTYAKGDRIYLEIEYLANGLTAGDPATVEYKVNYGGEYSSGPLPFDEGNPAEDPPYGLWGCLNDARAGGYAMMFMQAGDPDAEVLVEWDGIQYLGESVIPSEPTSWGEVKGLFR